MIVGDVCGHGVDEAALGVELRVAWRALVLAGVPDDEVLPALEQVLMSERRPGRVFATVATVTLDLAANRATVRLAGHPPPLLLSGRGRACWRSSRTGAGRARRAPAPPGQRAGADPDDWSLLLYTDGLIEGRVGSGARAARRGRVCGPARHRAKPQRRALPALPGWLVGRAEEANGGPLADDVAMLVVRPGGGRERAERRRGVENGPTRRRSRCAVGRVDAARTRDGASEPEGNERAQQAVDPAAPGDRALPAHRHRARLLAAVAAITAAPTGGSSTQLLNQTGPMRATSTTCSASLVDQETGDPRIRVTAGSKDRAAYDATGPPSRPRPPPS